MPDLGPRITARGFTLPLSVRLKTKIAPFGSFSCLLKTGYQDVVDWIDSERLGSRKLCVRSLNNANGRDVAVCFAGIDSDPIAIRHEDFIVNGIHIQAVASDLCMRSLNDSNWTLLSTGSSAERQDR